MKNEEAFKIIDSWSLCLTEEELDARFKEIDSWFKDENGVK